MRLFLSCMLYGLVCSTITNAQNHGSVTFQGKTILLSGYRTRMNQDKRVIIADGKIDGKLYSITVTLQPDMSKTGSVKTDTKHSATLTVSNENYSSAQNFCFDGGGELEVVLQNGNFMVSGTNLPAGNCFGQSKSGADKLSFAIKP